MRLIELKNPPRDDLTRLSFEEYEEETTDSERWIWFRKHLFTFNSLNVIAEVKYSLSISDDPLATYDNNCSYMFEGCALIATYKEVYDNNISSYDADSFEQKTRLIINTTEQLQTFVESATALSAFF